MNAMRVGQAALRLLNGQVLQVAGFETGALSSAEFTTSTLTPSGLVSITVSPQKSVMMLGSVQQSVATGTFSDNTTETLQSVTWSSSNSSLRPSPTTRAIPAEPWDFPKECATITATAGDISGAAPTAALSTSGCITQLLSFDMNKASMVRNEQTSSWEP